jgi:hypothetical protein
VIRIVLLILLSGPQVFARFNALPDPAERTGDTTRTDTTRTVNKKRLTGLVVGSTVAYGVAIYGLNELWYSHNPHQ